jgi:MarR family transcriptional regulator, multiple antibiotic resistance protein MarR
VKPAYEIEGFDPQKAVGYLMHRVRSNILAALDVELARDPALAALEVTASQYIIVNGLAQLGHESTRHLCKEMSYDPGAMTRMLDRLEAKGLIERSRCPNDRRLVRLELTEAGRAAVPRMRACVAAVLNRFLRGFSRAEVRQLEGLLERMIENA